MRRRRVGALALGAIVFALGALAAPAEASPGVLDIGDSLTVGAAPTLKQIVPGIQIDAQVGRPSPTGLSLLRSEYSGQGVVVFDLGTNDDPSSTGEFAAELQQVRQTIGNACLVLATINRPPYQGVSYAGLNRVIENFALRDGNTQVVPWADYPKLRPQVVYSDGVHVTPYGYTVRGHLIATAIQACGGSVAGPAGGQSNLPPPASAGVQPPSSPAPPAPAPPKPITKRMLVRGVASFVAGLVVDGVERIAPGALTHD